MSITLVNQPTSPNVTGTNLIYTVTSNKTSEPQFQYVADIYQVTLDNTEQVISSSLVTRIRQYPNPADAAVFDIHRILNDQLGEDKIWKTNFTSSAVEMLKPFQLRFGEEWSTSSSSSVTLYNGTTNSPGNPAYTGSVLLVSAGGVDPNNGTSYNLQSTAYLRDIPLTNYPFTYFDPGITGIDCTTSPWPIVPKEGGYNIALSDYHTFSFYTIDPYDFINMYVRLFNTGSVSITCDAINIYSPNTTMLHVLAGPQNFIDRGGTLGTAFSANNWAFYELAIYRGVEQFVIRFNKDENCFYDRVRFAFVNKLGVWDYYGVNLPQTKSTNISRSKIYRPFVDYSSANSTYNVTRRGQDYFSISYEDNLIVTTDFLSQDQAEWLSEMLESPSVYVQEGSNFVPIIITNSTYIHNTNPRGQKVFQYTIEYQYSNTRLGR